MRNTGKGRHDGAIAWMLLLVLHGLFGWMLTRIAHVPPPPRADSDLQVVYVQSIARDARRELRELSIAPGKRLAADAARPDSPPPAPTAPAGAVPATTTTRSSPAVLIEQGRQAIARQAQDDFAPADPFASRRARLPGAGGGRFRMRKQRTPEEVVNAVVGYLFAPQGYEQDPCPRNRSNIDGLITRGDSPALQRELEFERKYCRS